MPYLDYTDEWMRELTRERRREACGRREQARALHEGLDFPVVPPQLQQDLEAAWRETEVLEPGSPHLIWKRRQWEAGNRQCGYCGVRMTRDPNVPRTCTVDHRRPRAYGGADSPENWILCCRECNARKGLMREADYRLLLASQARIRGRLTA